MFDVEHVLDRWHFFAGADAPRGKRPRVAAARAALDRIEQALSSDLRSPARFFTWVAIATRVGSEFERGEAMAADDSTPFHPLVVEIVNDFEPVEGGPRMPFARVREWAQTVMGHADKEAMTPHLLVVARRFAWAGADLAAAQIVILASMALGAEAAASIAAEAGTDMEEAKQLVTQNSPTPGTPASGLAPPASKGPATKGR